MLTKLRDVKSMASGGGGGGGGARTDLLMVLAKLAEDKLPNSGAVTWPSQLPSAAGASLVPWARLSSEIVTLRRAVDSVRLVMTGVSKRKLPRRRAWDEAKGALVAVTAGGDEEAEADRFVERMGPWLAEATAAVSALQEAHPECAAKEVTVRDLVDALCTGPALDAAVGELRRRQARRPTPLPGRIRLHGHSAGRADQALVTRGPAARRCASLRQRENAHSCGPLQHGNTGATCGCPACRATKAARRRARSPNVLERALSWPAKTPDADRRHGRGRAADADGRRLGRRAAASDAMHSC